MMAEDFDVKSAAFKVVYKTSYQLCREYGYHFGESPSKDIRIIKKAKRL